MVAVVFSPELKLCLNIFTRLFLILSARAVIPRSDSPKWRLQCYDAGHCHPAEPGARPSLAGQGEALNETTSQQASIMKETLLST
jgi:hypothetical protein